MKHIAILSIVVLMALLFGCRSNPAAADQTVPFTVAKNYFVNNSPGVLPDTVITDQARFQEMFGMATTMGPDGKPTAIDFTREFVIAVAPPETNIATTLQATGLHRENGKLVFSVRINQGQPQTFTMRPLLLVVVDRAHLAPVRIKVE